MKPKLSLLIMAAALSTGVSALLAQDAPPPPPAGGEGRPPGGEGRPPGPPPQGAGDRIAEYLKRLDTDGNGKVSKEEFVAVSKKDSEDRFSKIDTNADGFADQAEVEEAGRRMRDQGGMRRPEGGGEQMRRPGEGPEGFRRPEGSGDGTRPRPGAEGQPGQPGPEGFRRPEGGSGGGEGRRPGGEGRPGESGGRGGFGGFGGGGYDLFKERDKDGDGILTKEEYLSSTEERFAQTDTNKDGKLTKEETDAYGARLREQFGGGRGGSGTGTGGSGGFRRPEGGPRPEGGGRPEGERPKRPEADAPAPPKDA
jgi:hypothetical protein